MSYNGKGIPIIGATTCQGPNLRKLITGCPHPPALKIAAPGVKPRMVCLPCSLLFRVSWLEVQMHNLQRQLTAKPESTDT